MGGGGEGSCEVALVTWLCLGKNVVTVYGWYCENVTAEDRVGNSS